MSDLQSDSEMEGDSIVPGRPRAFVYVDGFNLYNGLLKGTPYKWLDLVRLFDNLLPDYEVQLVRYFSAKLKGKASPQDPDKVMRQQVYLRALAGLDRIRIHLGHFEVRPARYRRRRSAPGESEMVDVWRPEEKGSDVNLATYLVRDAFVRAADLQLVVSNDSDLAEAIRIVTSELDQKVWLVFPHGTESKALMDCGHRNILWITAGQLRRSQLPERVVVDGKTLTKPAAWL